MTRRLAVALSVGLVITPASLEAQGIARVRAGGFYESYSFDFSPDSIFQYRKVSELTVPVGVDIDLGRFATVSLSSGFVLLDLQGNSAAKPEPKQDETLSGALETQVRVGVNVVPGRLIALATGGIPTGIKGVRRQELAILGALASDVIGFAMPSVGSGGSVGGGFVGAVPLGRFALGLGATYTQRLSYEPVVDTLLTLKPGGEIRARAGLEGPLARRTYLRFAGVLGTRAKDELGDTAQNGIGARLIGYLELAQGLGNVQLTVYGFDVYRSSPQVETTALGDAILPKGNLLAGGVRVALPLTRSLMVTPRAEFRYSSQAPFEWGDTDGDGIVNYVEHPAEKAGHSLRFALDTRLALARGYALVLTGGGITGEVLHRLGQTKYEVGLSGYRVALVLEVTP